jgi:4-amino-4-deoxy-L-arabinose transferase-like glycosyltransferase
MSIPSKKSIYILLWGLFGFGLNLIAWKILIIPIESGLGLLPDIPMQMLWREMGWAIMAWSFAGAVFVIIGLILEPWGPKGQLFRGRTWIVIAGMVVLSASFTMPDYWTDGTQGVVIGILQIVWGWIAIISAFGIIVGISGILLTHPNGVGKILNAVRDKLVSIKPAWIVLAASAWLLAITIFVAWWIFGGIPHVGDSVCQIFVAKTFLHGQLWAQPPPLELKPFFFETFLVDTNKWYSQYLPGYSLLMVPMVLIGATWLLNPLLSSLTVPVAYSIARHMGGELTGRYSAIALALSLFVIFMSGGQMNHPAMLFWASLAILSFVKMGPLHWRWWAFLAGLSLGMGVITRPLTGVAVALPLFLFWVNRIHGIQNDVNYTQDLWFRQLIYVVLGGAAPILFLLIYNHATTGNMFKVGYSIVWQGHTTLGFGDSSWGPPHTPGLGLVNTLNNLNGLNRYLYEIPIPVLVGLLLFVVFQRSQKQNGASVTTNRGSLRCYELLFSIIFVVFCAYFFYFFQDFCYGPRFVYVLVVPIIILIIAGIRSFMTALESLGYTRESIRSGLLIFGILCIIAAFTFSIPRQVATYKDYYWDISRHVLDEVNRQGLKDAIVFIEDFPSTVRHDKLHALGLSVRDSWYWARNISDKGLDAALRDMGLDPAMAWTPVKDTEYLWLMLKKHQGRPPSPQEDAAGGKQFTPYDSGLIAMDPHWETNSVIYARDLGRYDQVLIDYLPKRTAWLYSWDTFAGAFTLKPSRE